VGLCRRHYGKEKGLAAHDFRVFWMGHVGSIEAKYTTNKSILPKALVDEMRESFKRSEEFLDLENGQDHTLQKQKDVATDKLGKLTQEVLALLQKLLEKMGNDKTNASNNDQRQKDKTSKTTNS